MTDSITVQKWSPANEELKPITVTAAALQHLKKQIAKNNGGLGIRFEVKKTGCSGYGYNVKVIEETHVSDKIFPAGEGLIVAVDPESYLFLRGTQIDFIKDGFNERFDFHNPNEKGSCGCGESFTVEDK